MKDNELKHIESLMLDVFFEGEKQVAKWGIQDRSTFEWLAFLTEEVGELAEAISEYEYRGARTGDIYKEAIQVATLALKMAEMSRLISETKP
ncbi:MAG: hypothetical protein WC455_17655 [Dehalococcoidia bacterium]